MKINNIEIEKYRDLKYSNKSLGNNGLFFIKIETYKFKIIASDGMGWDHVSVSARSRCPNWKEMSEIKDLFFYEDETVVQFHPKKSEYVNNHPYCLHMWRNQHQEIELPPSILTGIKS